MKNVWLVAMAGFTACVSTEDYSSTAQGVQTAPTDVAATALTDSSVLVSWTETPDAFKYYVFRAEGAGPLAYIETVVAPGTSTVQAGLTASTEYSFAIESERYETSGQSEIATATTYPTGENYVQTPSNVAAAALDESRVQITWNAVPNAAKYYLYQGQGSDPVQYVGTLLAPTTTWISKSLASSSSYSFAIGTAMPDGLESVGYSAPVSATTYAPGQNSVQPPLNVAASAVSESRIQLSWDAVAGASKYYVFRAQGTDPLAYIATVASPSVTSLSTGLATSTQYSFAVATAMPDGRESTTYSTPVSTTTYASGMNNVQTPATVTATAASDSRIDLSWSPVAGASKYYLFRAQGTDPLVYTGTVLAPETTSMTFNLAPSTQYSFAIGTGMPSGLDSSGFSTPVTATTYATGQNNVQVPASVTATAVSDSRIQLSWTAVSGASKYYVFRAQGAGAFAYITTVLAPEMTLLATGLNANTSYSFAIGTALPDGRESAGYSTAGTAATLATGQNNAATPSDVTATAISDSRIDLSWSEVTGAAKYYVYRAEGAGTLAYIGTVVAPTTSLLSTNLAAGTQYTFAIGTAMQDGTESSGTSTPVSATTDAATSASAPTGLVATAVSATRVDFSWEAVAGATKYYVFEAQSTLPFAYVTSVVAPMTAYTASVAGSTDYSYTVQAVMADGTVSTSATPASVTTPAQ